MAIKTGKETSTANLGFEQKLWLILVAIMTIIANRTQSRTLATLRDTLLPKPLSGELSVTYTAEGLSA